MAFDATDFIPAKVDPLTITDPRERLKYLAGFLRELPEERFDMSVYTSDEAGFPVDADELQHCGTTACMCGWSVALFGLRCSVSDDDAVGQALGLSGSQAFDLFIPAHKDRMAITTAEAVVVLENLLLTGEVDWGVAS